MVSSCVSRDILSKYHTVQEVYIDMSHSIVQYQTHTTQYSAILNTCHTVQYNTEHMPHSTVQYFFFFFQIIINKRPLGNEYNTK